MSVRSQALVPLSTEQQATWRAVAETEKRRHQGNTLAEYPYAGAFFRCLNGSRRISLSDLRFFMPSLTAEELHGNRLQWLYAIDVLIETQGRSASFPFPVMQQSGCFRRCGFVSGSAVAINPRWSCRSTAASRHGRQSRKPVRTRRWSLRLKSNWHSIRRKQSEAGMHAGVTGWQSMTWKPCSGSGASVFRHWPGWNAGSGRICHSGRLSRKPVWQPERPVMPSVRWSDGWCRTNSGRRREVALLTALETALSLS
ncbi:plasmid SOS inhibition protein PsiA [Escherichia coli]|nr:plasmid SOS inhibition protein PsiA [Escherichia coli]GCZ35171.1 plasmid SOS inhibition protein PsiA [Escherichia coli]